MGRDAVGDGLSTAWQASVLQPRPTMQTRTTLLQSPLLQQPRGSCSHTEVRGGAWHLPFQQAPGRCHQSQTALESGRPPLALPTDGELAQRDQAACPGPHRRRAQAWPPAGLSSLHAQPTVPAPGAFAAPLTEPPPSCPVPQVQSFLRGWLCRRKWKTIIQDYIRSPHADSMRKRNQVVFSMLEAEAEYVQQLHILVNNFLRPLRMAASSKKPPITHDDVSSIFLNR